MPRLLVELEEIRARLVALIAKREYSRLQLQQKLAPRCVRAEYLEQALDELQEAGVVDDDRFAQALVAQRLYDGWGYLRISQDLRQAGISEAGQVEHLASAGDSEFWQQQALSALQRKYLDLSCLEDRQARAKAIAFLGRRGFSYEHSCRACSQAASTDID